MVVPYLLGLEHLEARTMNEQEIVELKHAMGGVAELTREFFMRLTQEGFTESQALVLTGNWLSTVITMGGNGDGA